MRRLTRMVVLGLLAVLLLAGCGVPNEDELAQDVVASKAALSDDGCQAKFMWPEATSKVEFAIDSKTIKVPHHSVGEWVTVNFCEEPCLTGNQGPSHSGVDSCPTMVKKPSVVKVRVKNIDLRWSRFYDFTQLKTKLEMGLPLCPMDKEVHGNCVIWPEVGSWLSNGMSIQGCFARGKYPKEFLDRTAASVTIEVIANGQSAGIFTSVETGTTNKAGYSINLCNGIAPSDINVVILRLQNRSDSMSEYWRIPPTAWTWH